MSDAKRDRSELLSTQFQRAVASIAVVAGIAMVFAPVLEQRYTGRVRGMWANSEAGVTSIAVEQADGWRPKLDVRGVGRGARDRLKLGDAITAGRTTSLLSMAVEAVARKTGLGDYGRPVAWVFHEACFGPPPTATAEWRVACPFARSDMRLPL